MSNKEIVQKAQSILKDLGHEVSLGHAYELMSKLSGHASWNVASAKKAVFALTFHQEEMSKDYSPIPIPKSERKTQSAYKFHFHDEKGRPTPFKGGEAYVTFNVTISGSGDTLAEAAESAAQSFSDEVDGYGQDCRVLEHNIVDIDFAEEKPPYVDAWKAGLELMLARAKKADPKDAIQEIRNIAAGLRLVKKDAFLDQEQKRKLTAQMKEAARLWKKASKKS